ncbi:hypothetical protein BN12_220013 [Nostocoides japonicum T1-X7]|uniref:4Fe-4S Wbl-type domain-containing protein n=1 Tax=Nostocoides japonicum T1-X7 TaxID=1194083 RepID=A0A077M0J8_9MICO|nr:hypothetical protein [Tetrasphaera japonica]CCH77735.1 hypothetical protein BN12_220013 [Tetrasphaera japonica T1-X7]
MTAYEALGMAIAQAARDGRIPPCAYDPDMWVGSDHEDKQHAAQICLSGRCPVVQACRVAAEVRILGSGDRDAVGVSLAGTRVRVRHRNRPGQETWVCDNHGTAAHPHCPETAGLAALIGVAS